MDKACDIKRAGQLQKPAKCREYTQLISQPLPFLICPMFRGSAYGKSMPGSIASLICELKSSDPDVNIEACGRFASIYFDPLVGYLLRNKKFFGNREEAKDLVSDFIFQRIIEQRIVDGFDPNYGGKKRKFHHYLCRSLFWLYHQDRQKNASGHSLEVEPVFEEPDAHSLDDSVFEYVLAANLLFQSFLAVKTDCLNKGQLDMWNVFSIRVIKQAITDVKMTHAEIAGELGLENAKRSSHLLESGQQKFKTYANRILRESEPGVSNRTPEDLLKVLKQPPLPNFDLCVHLEKLAEISSERDEVFVYKSGEELRIAAEAWLNDREIAPMDEDELTWRNLLNQTVNEYQDSEQTFASASLSFSALISHSDETLVDLLFQPTSGIDALGDIRRASKKRLESCDDSTSIDMHLAIYTLVHTTDIINHGVCHSQNGRKSLLSNISSALSKNWLDEQSRWQLNEAAKRLTEIDVPFPRCQAS